MINTHSRLTKSVTFVVQKSGVRELHATPLHERAAWQQLDTQIRFVEYQLQSEHAQFLVSQLQAANSQYYAQFKLLLDDLQAVRSSPLSTNQLAHNLCT